MSNRWNAALAAGLNSALELRAYSSRLLGADPTLVLHGGGNTSVKGTWTRDDGTAVPCLHVKGSGADLAHVVAADFTPLALDPARALLDGPSLADDAFVAALTPLILRPGAPRPSIETLLHAALPASHVEHTHADNVLAVINTDAGSAIARTVFGDLAPMVPFRYSGFDLALACAEVFARDATDRTIGLTLAFHGVVAFGDDARTSYDNMLLLAQRAEDHLRAKGAWNLVRGAAATLGATDAVAMARLRLQLSSLAGFPQVLARDDDPEVMGFVGRGDLAAIALHGPPTPQHAVFTKRLPLLGQDADGYARDYREYLAAFAPPGIAPHRLPDPAPRVILDPRLGLVGAGIDVRHAGITVEVYRHDIDIISRASAHDRYRSLPPDQVLAGEIHYGGFERRRRATAVTDAPLLGAIVLVIGDNEAAGACAAACRAAGADVFVRPPAVDLAAVAVDIALAHGGPDLIAGAANGTIVPDVVAALFAQSPFALAPGASRLPTHRHLCANPSMAMLVPELSA